MSRAALASELQSSAQVSSPFLVHGTRNGLCEMSGCWSTCRSLLLKAPHSQIAGSDEPVMSSTPQSQFVELVSRVSLLVEQLHFGSATYIQETPEIVTFVTLTRCIGDNVVSTT